MLTLFIYSALDGAVAKFMQVLFLKKKIWILKDFI